MNMKTLLTGAAFALGLAGAAMAQDKTKVGFIYVGPIGDGGWTYEHHQGLLAVEAEFGDKVETVYQENVPEGADAERAMTQMALQVQNCIQGQVDKRYVYHLSPEHRDFDIIRKKI